MAHSPFDIVKFDFAGTHYYQSEISGKEVSGPDYLQARRQSPSSATDNPLYHGASYLSLKVTGTAFPGVHLRGELVGEMRGISYGVNNTDNMIVFPRFAFVVDTSLSLFGQRFSLFLNLGDTVNARYDQGLLFYNMDAQGTIIRLGWKSLRFYLEHIGDADEGIGLRVNDSRMYGLALDDLPVVADWNARIRASLIYQMPNPASGLTPASPRGQLYDSIAPSGLMYSLSANVYDHDGNQAYAQAAIRGSDHGSDPLALGALLIGARSHGSLNVLEWDGALEYRFYGGLFNAGFYNDRLLYRKASYSYKSVGNTIGPFLYPLSNLERPFSQWAVFTEYQDLKDMRGVSLQLRAKYYFWRPLMLRAYLDLNYIKPESVPGFLYPFFDIGLGWEPYHNISIVISLTNRAMNLDKSYTTYYLYKHPVQSMTVRWNIP